MKTIKKIVVRGAKIIFLFLKKVVDRIVFELNIAETYLKGDQCETYADCRLLYTLLRSQPPASDRYIEYPWMVEQIRDMTSGRILDIGSTIGSRLFNFLPPAVEIHGIDLNDTTLINKNIHFKIGDIRKTSYADEYFDRITCISTLEHIGVSGRYGSDEDPTGDTKAMKEMKRILKKGGILLMTVPYGLRDVLPINKLYNKERLRNLLQGFEIVTQEFRRFDPNWRVWLTVTEEEAHNTDMLKNKWYALALIKVKKI